MTCFVFYVEINPMKQFGTIIKVEPVGHLCVQVKYITQLQNITNMFKDARFFRKYKWFSCSLRHNLITCLFVLKSQTHIYIKLLTILKSHHRLFSPLK